MIKQARTMYFAGNYGEFKAFLEEFHSKAKIMEITLLKETSLSIATI